MLYNDQNINIRETTIIIVSITLITKLLMVYIYNTRNEEERGSIQNLHIQHKPLHNRDVASIYVILHEDT